jgi:hypothetical protein
MRRGIKVTGDLKKLEDFRDALLLAQVGALLHNMGKITPQFLNKMIHKKDEQFRYQHILHLIEEDYRDLQINIPKLYDDLNKDENQNVLDTKTVNALKRRFTLPHPFDDRRYRPGDFIEYLGQGELVFGKKLYARPYLFNWDIQSKDYKKIKNFLKHNFDIGIKKDDIEKTDDDMTIQISYENHSISLELNEEKTEVNLKIDDVRTVKLIVITEHDQLKVYGLSCWITKIFPGDSRLTRGSRLTHLMNRSHRGASGGEKQAICTRDQTDPDKLYKSTPFGWESAAPNLNDTKEHKQEIEKIIQNQICSDIKSLNFDSFANQLRPRLETAIADLQRPLNDITVWDIGHSGMAFLLTQAIGLMMQEKNIDHNELSKIGNENTLFWRVVSIRMDGLDYLGGASSLADLRVRYSLIQETLEHIRNTLEGIPLAIEVYRDENGSFYIFPNLDDDDQLTKEVLNLLESKLTVDGIKLNYSLSEKLINHPDDENPDEQYIGKYICEQIESKAPKANDLTAYTAPWQSAKNKEICVACGIRPQGYGSEQISNYQKNPSFYARKARGRNICCSCMHRRTGVSERWAIEGLYDSTVWIDEVADMNGRVALVIGQFNLHNWEMWYPEAKKGDTKCSNIDTMVRSQSFARIRRVWETTRNFWQDILPTKEETEISKSEGGRVLGFTGPRLAISGDLISEQKKSTLGPYHAYLLRLKNINLNVVWDSNNQQFITSDNLNAIAEPTRLGENVEVWLKANIGKSIIIEEPTGYGSQNKNWGSIKIENVEPIPDSKYTSAIPILAEPRTFMALVPANKALDLVNKINEKYEREMGKVRNRLPLHIGVVFSPYKTPLRTILDAGRRMMIEKTVYVDGWKVIETEYFIKDAELLPETLRNDPHFTECVRLKLTRDNHTAVWHVPLSMGDGKTKDNWYPYVFVQHDKNENTPSGRKRMFEAPCPWNLDSNNTPQLTCLVHAKDIEELDVIYFTPSTLDFQWLDTSGRRFEIDYDNKGRRRDMPQRPYMLEDLNILQGEIWETLKKYLSTSQIHVLYELIETKRYEWEVSDSEVFRKFCCDVIANVEWKKHKIHGSTKSVYPWKTDIKPPEKDWLTQWADYAVRGCLSDVIELYMKVLKEKPEN